MLRNYIKIAFRDLVRHKEYTLINMVGLTLGITCCLLIFLFIQSELSFDRFHSDSDRLFRIIQCEKGLGELSKGSPSTSALLESELKQSFPDIEYASRLSGIQAVVKRGMDSYFQSIVHVDSDFFQMFSFPFIQGNSSTAFANSSDVVISSEMANKFYGSQNPINQTISIQLGDTLLDFNISGIVENPPSNSSIQFDFLISSKFLKYTTPERYLQSWNMILFPTFIKVKTGTDIDQLESLIGHHLKPIFDELESGDISFFLQPIADIHLNPNYPGEMIPSTNPVYIWILGSIAAIILLVACMNFVTLSIGRSAGRTREVGLRKVMGAQKSQIIRQFWCEALIQSTLALFFSIALAEALLPTFNLLAEKQLALELFSNIALFPVLIVIAIITALLAGSYPAFLISRQQPAVIFKGNNYSGGKNRLIKGLVIIQFSVSIFLIICMMVMSSQINYINDTNLGFNQDYVITVSTGSGGEEAANMLNRFRDRLLNNPDVKGVTGYSYDFGQSWLYLALDENDEGMMLIGEDVTGAGYSEGTSRRDKFFYVNWVDAEYIPTFGINLASGRNFDPNNESEYQNSVIINKKAADVWGLKNPVGEKCPIVFDEATIIGVVEDFHYYPLNRQIEPMVLHLGGTSNISSIYNIAVKIDHDNFVSTISQLENVWKDITTGSPFNYAFLDDNLKRQYFDTHRWYDIIKYAFIFSMIITCLGLIGLISLAVSRKTKEIGIRKVLGAGILGIINIILNEFLMLILLANIIAWPLAYYVMQKWLDNYAYRIELGWFVFVLSTMIALTISLLTISIQIYKAARTNPVETLRYE